MADTDTAERPTALTYGLEAGQEGYWPVLAAVPDDIEVGDRVSFTGDTEGDIVAEVRREELNTWPLRIGYVTREGKLITVGRMARGFRLDRWGTSVILSRKGTR